VAGLIYHHIDQSNPKVDDSFLDMFLHLIFNVNIFYCRTVVVEDQDDDDDDIPC